MPVALTVIAFSAVTVIAAWRGWSTMTVAFGTAAVLMGARVMGACV